MASINQETIPAEQLHPQAGHSHCRLMGDGRQSRQSCNMAVAAPPLLGVAPTGAFSTWAVERFEHANLCERKGLSGPNVESGCRIQNCSCPARATRLEWTGHRGPA